MNTLRLFRLELRRLLHCRMTWLAVVFSLILYLAGYSLYQMLGYTTMAVLYLANPIALCTLGSTIDLDSRSDSRFDHLCASDSTVGIHSVFALYIPET